MREIALSGKKGAGRVALVDDEDYEFLAAHRWYLYESRDPRPQPRLRPNGPYAQTWIERDGRLSAISMHKLLTGWPRTDHIDRDGLNNQRSNLRPATRSQNSANSPSRLGSSSQYKGVCWSAKSNKWQAGIRVNNKNRHLGLFASEEEAALAYNVAALEAWGEFAYLNDVRQQPEMEKAS